MIEEKKVWEWESYEEVAVFLLDQMTKEFGLSHVEGKQELSGKRSGTAYEIGRKGVSIDGEGFIILECRRYTRSRQKQKDVAALAYSISDTGAQGGIIVSPLGLQEGATKIAKAENIISVQLDENSATKDYVLRFLEKVFIRLSDSVRGVDSVFVKKD